MSFKFIIITHTDAAPSGSSSEMSLWPFVETGHVDLFDGCVFISVCVCVWASGAASHVTSRPLTQKRPRNSSGVGG